MQKLLFSISLFLFVSAYGQPVVDSQADTSIHKLENYWFFGHWSLYPATSALYVPPCQYRIVPSPISNEVADPYDYEQYEQFKLAIKQGKYGILNAGDTIVIPLKYDSLIRVSIVPPQVFIAQLNGKFGLINTQHEIVIPFEYDQLQLLSNGHYYGSTNHSLLVQKNGKKGLMWIDGSTELSCTYETIDVSCNQTDCPKNGLQYHVSKNGKYGYINQDESIAIKLAYEGLDATGFSGLIKAKNNDKVGLMDTLEQFIVPQIYEQLYAEYFSDLTHPTAFKQNNKWGLMAGPYEDMQIIVPNIYDTLFTRADFKDHFIVMNQNKWGLVDTTGKLIIPTEFQEIIPLDNGTFAYKKNNKWGFMSAKGSIFSHPKYDEIVENHKNWCLVKKGEGYGFCKTSGQEIIAPNYHAPYWDDYLNWDQLLYTGSIALVKMQTEGNYDCKMGVIDSTGKVLLPFEYDCTDELVYEYGRTMVLVKNGKQVLITKNGKELDLGEYDQIEDASYEQGYFFIKKGDQIGLVSQEGKIISKPIYDDIDILQLGGEGLITKRYILVKIASKYGLLDTNGKELLAPKHQALGVLYNDKVEVLFDNQVKIYNLNTQLYESFIEQDDYSFNGHVGIFRQFNSIAFFIDKEGRRINDINYQHIWHNGQKNNTFMVYQNGRVGICDSTGQELFAPKFTKIKYWDGEFGAGKKGDRYCFFDAKGDTLVGYRYQKVKGVYKDFVCVKINGKFGVVSKQGKELLAPTLDVKLDMTELAQQGFTTFKKQGKYGVLDSTLQIIVEPIYQHIQFLTIHQKKYMLAHNHFGYSLKDTSGNSISNLLFSQYTRTANGELLFEHKGINYVVNKNGVLVEE